MVKELGKDREEFQFWAVMMYLYELSDILIWATIIIGKRMYQNKWANLGYAYLELEFTHWNSLINLDENLRGNQRGATQKPFAGGASVVLYSIGAGDSGERQS